MCVCLSVCLSVITFWNFNQNNQRIKRIKILWLFWIFDSSTTYPFLYLPPFNIYLHKAVCGSVGNAFLKPGNISSIPVQIMSNLKPLVTETLLALCLPPPPSTQCKHLEKKIGEKKIFLQIFWSGNIFKVFTPQHSGDYWAISGWQLSISIYILLCVFFSVAKFEQSEKPCERSEHPPRRG